MKKFIVFLILFLSCAVLTYDLSYANNIAVSSVQLGTQDTVADTMVVQFNISWENSWRDVTNYDAAWVFIKYSIDSGAAWNHATLKTSGTNPINFSSGTGTGLDIAVPADKKGAFLQRSADGTGLVSNTAVQFVWDYGTDITAASKDTDVVLATVRVMAVEMVYIPTGSFDLGDGNGANESVYAFHITDNTKLTIGATLVQNIKVDVSNDDIQLQTGIGIDGDGGLDSNNDGIIDNANFPTGYNAFYIMKYEISQGQYRDFLNMLTRAQQNTRTTFQSANLFAMNNLGSFINRNGIRNPAVIPAGAITFGVDGETTPDGVFNEANDGEWRACNFLWWGDLCAFADWSALRPITELEYEKAARGPTSAVYSELAGGQFTTITALTDLLNDGGSNESRGPASPNANYIYANAGPNGPIRCGMFATVSSTRAQAGASYYGVMELSGNLFEEVVVVGSFYGRLFAGTNGDGSLSLNGGANNVDWPGFGEFPPGSQEVNGDRGTGQRGGSWAHFGNYLCVSDRGFAAIETSRSNYSGSRCARTP